VLAAFSDKPSPSSYGEDPIVVIDLIGKYLANKYFFQLVLILV
jgi:hypothetical protein